VPINLSEENPVISAFLGKHHVGVLATANASGEPHAATIYFTTDEQLNIYFITKTETTKHRNIQANPQVALAVHEEQSQATLQISGIATKIEDSGQFQEIFGKILSVTVETSTSAIPPFSQLQAGGYIAYCIQPKTLRLAEYIKAQHGAIEELFDVSAVPDKTLE
jgi:general stress protein 26